MFKKLLLGVTLVASALFGYAQSTSIATLMNNPANSSTSAVLPDTTRAAGAYTFVSPIVTQGSRITIQCIAHKDSGTIAGDIHIEGTIDPAASKNWQTLVVKAGDSLLMTNGNNSRYWQYGASQELLSTDINLPVADFFYYRAVLNQTNISRQDIKCWIRSR